MIHEQVRVNTHQRFKKAQYRTAWYNADERAWYWLNGGGVGPYSARLLALPADYLDWLPE